MNTASNDYTAVSGGSGNQASGINSQIAGGLNNSASGSYSSVGGGQIDTASGLYAVVGGGNHNAAGNYSAIPGGRWLTIGTNSFGFNGDAAGTASQTDISNQSGIAYFGNVNVELGNVDGTSRELRFYGPNADHSFVGAHYTALKAASLGTNTSYVLPAQYPAISGELLMSTSSGAMNWTPSLAWDSTNRRLGVGNTVPNTSVDVSGDLALRSWNCPIVNGTNNDIAIDSNSFIRIAGPTAAFTITGISGGVDGKIVMLYNPTSYTMTINHDDAGSLSGNRIYCHNGTFALSGPYGVVKLIYSSADNHWIVLGTN